MLFRIYSRIIIKILSYPLLIFLGYYTGFETQTFKKYLLQMSKMLEAVTQRQTEALRSSLFIPTKMSHRDCVFLPAGSNSISGSPLEIKHRNAGELYIQITFI